jgi:branched-chain amino acid transport system permease protein
MLCLLSKFVAIEPILRDAVIFASLLSLLSVGLTLTYLVTKVPNFSQGSIATVGIYVTLSATQLFHADPYEFLPIGFLLGGLANLILYFAAIRPLSRRGSSLISLMVATIAYDLVLVALLNIYADYIGTAFKIASRDFILQNFDLQLLDQPGVFITAPVIAVALSVGLYVFLTKTRFGVAMRAAIEDQALAGVLGINVRRVYVVSWFLSGGLGGLAGSMLGLWFLSNPDYGDNVLISIFASSVVGGLQNIYGGVLGGLLVGIAEILGTSWLGSIIGSWVLAYKPVIPLVAMATTLLLAPKGITGVKWLQVIRRITRR